MDRIAIVAAFLLLLDGGMLAANDGPSFSDDVRPILSDKCYKCHGPDETARQGELRFDQRASAARVLGDSAGMSELVRRITSDTVAERMPPPDSKLTLTPAEIQTLRQWVEEGAVYEQHWSFVPVRKPRVPAVRNDTWPRNEIDAFVLARMKQHGLTPSPPAAKERLLRRLSFDLTGLAPTLEELDLFLTDPSDDAYEQAVDRLLESTAFGERMAADWLDVARYADSFGYQVDRERRVWPWRDWVIESFNSNMPYDQFITWQLAGDLLPNATDQQRLATTFNRLHSQKVEGGSVPEEFRVEYVADRTQTVATAFMGLTMECARCHDHKYDPITQKDYYQLFAFFNNIDECGVYSYFTSAVPTPTLLLTNDIQKQQIADLEQRVRDEQRALDDLASTREDAFEKWLSTGPDARRAALQERLAVVQVGNAEDPADDQPPEGSGPPSENATTDETATDVAMPDLPGCVAHLTFEDHEDGANVAVDGVVGRAVRLSGDDGIELAVGNFRRDEPFSVSLWMNTPEVKDRAVVFHRSRAWTDAGSRGYQLLIEKGRLSASLIHFWPGNAIRVKTQDVVAPLEWHHVAMVSDGSSRAEGLQLFVNGVPADCEVVQDNLYKNITGGGGENITIGERFRDRGFTNGRVDEVRVFRRQLTPIEVAQLHDGHSLDAALATDAGQCTDSQRARLREYYLNNVDESYGQQQEALSQARRRYFEVVDGTEEIMVMQDRANVRPTHLLNRGAYDDPRDEVAPDTPSAFVRLAAHQPRNRLDLANWLTAPDHPLTSRVVVNRIWQMLFGRGFVGTPEDFGSQGSPPTHPELLDWLASDLLEHGWDIKRLIKICVMSSTYRQSSAMTAEQLATDPDNLWLGRAPRYRLPAEMIRDNGLATSGLLVEKIGGPPARPYELAVSFKPITPDEGEGRYRRSLYTYWKRTAPAPVMMALDVPKRDVCTVKRERTASPLQALVLMNDPQLLEASRALALRLLQAHRGDVDAAIRIGFRMLTSRPPNQSEVAVLRGLYDQQLARFAANTEGAKAFWEADQSPVEGDMSIEQMAAFSVVANTVMNLDECVTKR